MYTEHRQEVGLSPAPRLLTARVRLAVCMPQEPQLLAEYANMSYGTNASDGGPPRAHLPRQTLVQWA